MKKRCLHCVLMEKIQEETSDKDGTVDLLEVIHALALCYADTVAQGDNDEQLQMKIHFTIGAVMREKEHEAGNLVQLEDDDPIGTTKGRS